MVAVLFSEVEIFWPDMHFFHSGYATFRTDMQFFVCSPAFTCKVVLFSCTIYAHGTGYIRWMFYKHTYCIVSFVICELIGSVHFYDVSLRRCNLSRRLSV